MNRNTPGSLYIVATPIGNLQDITLRALETLKSVQWIVAEDTRHSGALLAQYAISTPVSALHEHNERERADKIIALLEQGDSVALISDAGTPLISDPGYYLVQAAREKGLKVVPMPGACAAIAALSVAGLPTDRFVFEGFLPAKSSARRKQLDTFLRETRTVVFYESPHRILDTLQDMVACYGLERRVVVARELTKLFETVMTGTLASVLQQVESDPNQRRGEMVVLLAGCSEAEEERHDFMPLLQALLEALPLKQAVEITAKITGEKKNTVYDAALQWRANRS